MVEHVLGTFLKDLYRDYEAKLNNANMSVSYETKAKFNFIAGILENKEVDPTKYCIISLKNWLIDTCTFVHLTKSKWDAVNRIISILNLYYQHNFFDNNVTADKLLKVIRSIYHLSNSIKEYAFGTSNYYDILKLDPDEIITKYNNYIKSTNFKIGDEICMILDPNMKAWITKIGRYDFECLLDDGTVRIFPKTDVKKTGRHNVSLGATLHDNMEGCIILEDVNNRE